MSEILRSIGLDVGTTSTQLILSELTVENRASGFAVPEMEITRRQILYKSPVHFTPLLGENLVDGEGIRRIVEAEYRNAGITRKSVDTGAVIITGETSRKENARAVLNALADLAGDFVVATAGPELESVLAAMGAGAAAYSEKTGKTVLHMDIGGGTSNLALIKAGKIIRTGCLNVGGRLIRLEESGVIGYVSPVLTEICRKQPGQMLTETEAEEIAGALTEALEMAAGLRKPTELMRHFLTQEVSQVWKPPEEAVVLSFSGGVADCIAAEYPWLTFGDLGPVLGQAIRKSGLCRGEYRLGSETIRATVIGAGCHSTQLSGSTVFYRNISFPLKNLPVVKLEEASRLAETAEREELIVFAMPGLASPSYQQIIGLAEQIAAQLNGPVLLCLERDMAKALGQALALRLPEDRPILCIDRIKVSSGSYLDIGAPVGHALPVIVKTLVLAR
ncbi:MAG: ethanolamine ammonia-lyase reactivating factor EutA [Oscillospiraceae bacterium]|nr:ethanolamine ammonia-lyase reactivating factor EutA [Oscillospiraceae bacterium]